MTLEEPKFLVNKRMTLSIWRDNIQKISITLISNYLSIQTRRKINPTPYKISLTLSELNQTKKSHPIKQLDN